MSDSVSLSISETEIFVLIGRGYTAKRIAAMRGTCVNTVRNQIKKAREKVGVKSSTQLAVMVALRRQQMKQQPSR